VTVTSRRKPKVRSVRLNVASPSGLARSLKGPKGDGISAKNFLKKIDWKP
jgi:hypothetical protein